ncbi:ATP-dependent Clp protease proteolytic subunit [Candidatus Obscuribacterales bacterium]|nr:ATP-dependent Clp protease proteolytic subunit [Candidatus Obscuribacterales bacterium]MBX3136994.1 ATP-dependent Clp protease proteolytic subunit [Candidatus Obscuribacterales bacterium]MBX3153264.1 ATP-dependent Clp protease proteolytic subunit [Candidatus Obscuribacterales bacterium]
MSKKNQESKVAEKKENDELSNRDVYVFGRLENEVATPVIRRLLRLVERDPKTPINLYINSAGGNGYNADAIIAIMHSIPPKVNTICLGHALSGACEILASGTGERSAYEFSTLMFHQTIWEAEGDITSLEIQALQGQRFRNAQIELLHRCTGQDRERIRKDIERDYYLSAQEALEYGIVDSIIKHTPRKSAGRLSVVSGASKSKSAAVAASSKRAATSKSTKASTSKKTTGGTTGTRGRSTAAKKTTRKK